MKWLHFKNSMASFSFVFVNQPQFGHYIHLFLLKIIMLKLFLQSLQKFTHFVNVNPSHYNLAILDIRMPDLNELQLYYRLKAINRKIKILFVSALDAVPELVSILPDVKITNDIIKKPVALILY